MKIIDAIKRRTSVRNFDGKSLPDGQVASIQRWIAQATSPFGGSVSIRLARMDGGTSFRPSTYGVITGARQFLLLAMRPDRESALSAGYMMERIVLNAVVAGLGTCWVGGTFSGSSFDRGMLWPDGERLRIVVPVGVAASRKAILSELMSLAVGSRRRRPFGSLFFDCTFATPLSHAGAGGLAFSLEMMRLAPSSMNSQPWRAIVEGGVVHFFMKRHSDLSLIDMGIGLCHFHEAEMAARCSGEFFMATGPAAPPTGLSYLISYRRLG